MVTLGNYSKFFKTGKIVIANGYEIRKEGD